MKCLVCNDVSEFNAVTDATYPRDFLIFRGSFGAGYQDHHFLGNASAVAAAYNAGTLAGAVIYTVYLPGAVKAQYEFLWNLIGPSVPPWLAGIMIDVEGWRGTSYEIDGDHSSEINRLYGLHASKMGSYDSVIAYGNANDLTTIYPGRDKRCRVIVAGYSNKLTYRAVPGAIGQQYTDGSGKWPVPAGLPTSTPPFGHCDHNVFPDFANGAALRALLRPAPAKHRRPGDKRPPTKPPVKPPVRSYKPGIHRLVSGNRQHRLVITDDGVLQLESKGKITWHS